MTKRKRKSTSAFARNGQSTKKQKQKSPSGSSSEYLQPEHAELSVHHLVMWVPCFPKVLHTLVFEFVDDTCIHHFELFQARANELLGKLHLAYPSLECETWQEYGTYCMIMKSIQHLNSSDLFPMLESTETADERLRKLIQQGEAVLGTCNWKVFNEELYAQMTSSWKEPRMMDAIITPCWKMQPQSGYQFLNRLSSLHDACPTTLLLFYLIWRGMGGVRHVVQWIATQFQKHWGKVGAYWFLYVSFYVMQHLSAEKISVEGALYENSTYNYLLEQILVDLIYSFSRIK